MNFPEPSPASSPPSMAAQLADRLHEDLCQTLSGTTLLAAILKKDLEARGAEETAQAEEIYAELRRASQAVRKLMTDLRAAQD